MQQAQENLEGLAANPYPGRGIVLGRSEDGGALVQLYWIMGRSANSRNRVFIAEGETLRTAPHDPETLKDPSLVIYRAMARQDDFHVVTNGNHTDTIVDALHAGKDPASAMRTRMHEPDAPNHTPRIAGATDVANAKAWLAIVKADPADATRSLRQFFEIDALDPGIGWCITTYDGDGDPLPSFKGEPRVMPLAGPRESLLDAYWGRLNGDNRVALALKLIEPSSGVTTILVRNAHGSD